MRQFPANLSLLSERSILRVTELGALGYQWQPDLLFLLLVSTTEDLRRFLRLVKAGVSNIALLTEEPHLYRACDAPRMLVESGSLKKDDVVVVLTGRQIVQVLFRSSDQHHTVFLTNRCNSNCLMCSQPPSQKDDYWLVDEAKRLAAHLPSSPSIIGFTGGEPTLLGRRLREILDFFSDFHPTTNYEVLTNARLFNDPALANSILKGLQSNTTWMVPLYGHTNFLHDFVVQSQGAFEETINGLLSIHSYRQQIQLRIVLIPPVIEVLPELCDFISRNLPFVKEVALMGCEPTGFALANVDYCRVDIADWGTQLTESVLRLRRNRVPAILMNLPLCGIPSILWPIAHRSISDWKQTYVAECEGCDYRNQCSGLFMWSGSVGWRPTKIRMMKEKLLS